MVMEVEAVSNLQPDGQITSVINTTDIATGALAESPQLREIAGQLSRWVDNARAVAGRTSMFDRGMFLPPENPYDEMRAARNAIKYDSVIAGLADTTESFAFSGVKWESPDEDEADVFNQIARDQNLDALVRAMWREEFTYGQSIVAKMWGWREYTVRGKTKKGNRRKKTYRVWAPLQLKLIDPLKTVPIGLGPLAGERLAWQATLTELDWYRDAYAGDRIDPVMLSFFDGTYQPTLDEARELARLGVDPTRLLVMNQSLVFRHTSTKPDYERFADVKLKSCFALLDMKRQLLASDRATLVGSANYILLIRKGDKDRPAQQEEIQNLRENYNFIAKMPVIISDDRLSIDIIAPKTDFVLNADKYDVLDNRLMMRVLGTLTISSHSQRAETQETISYAVARNLENRRHMLKRTFEVEIARAVVEHPKNANVFDLEPNLVYSPRNLAFSLAPAYVTSLLALRTQREISRETILEVFGLDQETEAMYLENEGELFDDIFKTEIPYTAQQPGATAPNGQTKDGPNTDPTSRPASGQPSDGRQRPTPNGTPEAPGSSGARGGRPAGGGNSTGSPANQARPRTRNGNPSTRRA